MPTDGFVQYRMTTVGAALRQATSQLQPRSDSAELDARLLLAQALGVTLSRLYSDPQTTIDAVALDRFQHSVERRASGEPLAYITGHCGFWTLELAVNPAVLVPRPDTETLVEAALELLPLGDCSIIDLGTGSGAIALALASERPAWHVTATDASPSALACAGANAERLLPGRVQFLHGHWFEPIAARRFDAIVSNPPYVAPGDHHLQAPELQHEPAGALVAADNGRADLAHISCLAPDHLNPGGWLLLEHGHDQGADVRELLQQHGFGTIGTRKDLGGNERVTCGRLA